MNSMTYNFSESKLIFHVKMTLFLSAIDAIESNKAFAYWID